MEALSMRIEITCEHAKQCSLKCIDEIVKSNPINPRGYGFFETTSDMVEGAEEYWNQVKEELRKL